jgi:hypothetical protein
MKTLVETYKGLNIYRVDTRGQTAYKSNLIFGEYVHGKTVDELKKKIDSKLAAGDTRTEVTTHEGVKIFQVREGTRTYFISEPVVDEVIEADTAHEVEHGITRRHALLGR